MTEQIVALRQVRDWRGLVRWASDYSVPIETRRTHRRMRIGDQIITISTSLSDHRALKNAWSYIIRALEAGN